MAEQNEDKSREDLTEEASPYRLEEYRKKGHVVQSRELTGIAAMLAAAVTLYAMAPKMGIQLTDFMTEVFRHDFSSRFDLGGTHVARGLLEKALKLIATIGLPISIAGFVVGAIASFVQVGTIFSWDPLTPDINKLDPLQGIRRLFSIKHGVDSLRLIFKMAVVVFVSYALLKTAIFQAPASMGAGPQTIFSLFAYSAKNIFMGILGILILFAAVDLYLQRREYNKSLRLTKQEAKQEHKEREGDPQIKARIRSIQREVARRRMMQAVKKADVIITNPTHIAVAVVYDKSAMMAPRVVAKGADFVAQKIKKIAADAGIPMVENVPLARTLYKTVKIGQMIPRALYQSIAEVLAYVYRLKKREA